MSNLNIVRHKSLANLIGAICVGSCGIAVHGANAENLLTANAVSASVGGVFVAIPATTEIDVSAMQRLILKPEQFNTKNWVTGAASDPGFEFNAIAPGESSRVVLMVNAAGVFHAVQSAVSIDMPEWPSTPDEGYTAFAAISIVNNSATSFDIGATDLGTAGVVVTYQNLSHVPLNL